jgi:hypothetical protein
MGAPQGGELYRCDRRFVNVVAAISLSFFLGLGVGGLFSAQSNNQWRETVGLNLALVPERKAALQAPPPGDRDCSLPQPVRVWVREVPNYISLDFDAHRTGDFYDFDQFKLMNVSCLNCHQHWIQLELGTLSVQ